jgi:hypothetical protein
VTRGLADLLDVEGADALLHARGTQVRRGTSRWWGTNGTIPATVNRRVGSSLTRGGGGNYGVAALGEEVETSGWIQQSAWCPEVRAYRPGRRGLRRVVFSER